MIQKQKMTPTKVAFKPQPIPSKFSSQISNKNLSKPSSFLNEDGAQHSDFEQIKRKHDKIALLESEISIIQKRLTEFYFKMKEVLGKDQVLNRELRQIFFNESLKEHIEQCDPVTLVEFIEKIIVGAVNLSHNLADIPMKSQILGNESDYVLILQKMEEEILMLKQHQLEDEFVIESLKQKIEELQEHNARIIDKSAQTAQSFKQDYYKLLTIIHELEYDISHLKDRLNEKEGEIQAINEKNFSIYVLEHKIKSLDQKYKKDVSKAKAKFNQEIKFIKNTRVSDPNFFHRMHGVETQIRSLENKLYSSEVRGQKIEEDKNFQLGNINEERTNLERRMNEMSNEIFSLKEKIAEKNREINFLKLENQRKNELRCINVSKTNADEHENPVANNYSLNNNKKTAKSFNFNNSTTFNKTWGIK